MARYAYLALWLSSLDSRVFTKNEVVCTIVNNSKLLYSDKIESRCTMLPGLVQPASVKPGLALHNVALVQVSGYLQQSLSTGIYKTISGLDYRTR